MSRRLLVATRKGLFIFSERSGAWSIERQHFLGDQVTMVLDDGKAIYAALGHGHFGGKLHKSTDAGATFTEIERPK
jgi:hypothetical protein